MQDLHLGNVKICAVAGFCSEDPQFDTFRPRKIIPDRKSIKLMTRSVQLGVGAAAVALSKVDVWKSVPPHRRGVFVSASPAINGHNDLHDALVASRDATGSFSHALFAQKGRTYIHPLWLVRGLSNNILGFVSSLWDFQGENMNYCQGELGGRHALIQAAAAITEGRLDMALVGGADSLVGAEHILGRSCAEAGVFIVLMSAQQSLSLSDRDISAQCEQQPYTGAAGWLLALWKIQQKKDRVKNT